VGVKKGRGKKVQYAMEVDESDVVPERVPASAMAHNEEEVDEEANFPDVKLDELLEGSDELTVALKIKLCSLLVYSYILPLCQVA